MSSSIPETCKAVVIEKAGAPWTIKQVPVKTPEAGEILVKVQACGVCHSDSAVQAGHFGAMYVVFASLCRVRVLILVRSGSRIRSYRAMRSLAKSPRSDLASSNGRSATALEARGTVGKTILAKLVAGVCCRCAITSKPMALLATEDVSCVAPAW